MAFPPYKVMSMIRRDPVWPAARREAGRAWYRGAFLRKWRLFEGLDFGKQWRVRFYY